MKTKYLIPIVIISIIEILLSVCFLLELDLRHVREKFYHYKKGASFLFWMSCTSREQPIRKSHHQKRPIKFFLKMQGQKSIEIKNRNQSAVSTLLSEISSKL